MTGEELRTYYLWLEGEHDSIVHEASEDGADKYLQAYQAAVERGVACTITDETGLADEESGPVLAIVHKDGDVTDGQGNRLFSVFDRVPDLKLVPTKVVAVCTNASGSLELHSCELEVNKVQIELGEHYELAQQDAENAGYETLGIAFDANDDAAKQLLSVAAWLQTS